jgi:hypothetical protein
MLELHHIEGIVLKSLSRLQQSFKKLLINLGFKFFFKWNVLMPKGKNLDGHGSLLGYEFYKLRNMKSFFFCVSSSQTC